MKMIMKVSGAIAGLLLAAQVQAVPINGSATFDGGGATVTTNSFVTPTQLDFGPGGPGVNGDAHVDVLTGDMATIVGSLGLFAGAMSDVNSNPFGPDPSFITIGNLEFDLISFNMIGTGATISGIGTGTFIDLTPGTLFDPTPGYFIFTTQSAGGLTNSWSASLTTSLPGETPAPAPLALLALGLLGMVFLRRKA